VEGYFSGEARKEALAVTSTIAKSLRVTQSTVFFQEFPRTRRNL